MRYRIDRVGFGSALRFAAAIGVALALLPGLCIAGLALQLLQRAGRTLAGMREFAVEIPEQKLGPIAVNIPPIPIDLVQRLGLAQLDQTIGGIAAHPARTFLLIAIALILAVALALILAALLACAEYNLLARYGGGIEVEVRPRDATATELGASGKSLS
ncbi:MAG TPA: hypothetical protein VF897_00140 [Roseiflexaceae bacterium]